MTQGDWLWTAGAAAALAAVSILASRRQAGRRDLDRPGWVPWELLTVLGMLVAAVSIAVGLQV